VVVGREEVLTMTSHLREHDADLMLRLLQVVADDLDPGVAAPWSLLAELQRLVPCDLDVAYQHHDFAARRTELVQALDGSGERCVAGAGHGDETDDDGDEWWDGWWTGICSWPQRAGDLHSVVHTGDFYPSERDRLAHVSADCEVRTCMMLSLPAEPGHARRLTFMRHDGPDFSERDRQVLTLLRPHVVELVQAADRRRSGAPRLTAREWEVLSLVACGLTYPEIAVRLVVSVSTVRKHMEHVRERLGVSSAAAAAAVAMPHAPTTVPGQRPLTT
jgi:DNA-binding CsgD family transcriptional regulator